MKRRPYKVLFVCTGNLCRSPMAQGLLTRLLVEYGVKNIRADSAGTHASTGLAPTDEAMAIAHAHGIDLTGIRSKPVTAELVQNADCILAMGEMNRTSVVGGVPEASGKIHLLKSFDRHPAVSGSQADIPDPMGGDRDAYETCFLTLHQEIERIFPLLIKHARESRSHA